MGCDKIVIDIHASFSGEIMFWRMGCDICIYMYCNEWYCCVCLNYVVWRPWKVSKLLYVQIWMAKELDMCVSVGCVRVNFGMVLIIGSHFRREPNQVIIVIGGRFRSMWSFFLTFVTFEKCHLHLEKNTRLEKGM